MIVKPSESVTVDFTTSDPTTGALADADSTPTGALVENGVDDGAVTVTVTNKSTGRYKASFTVPADYTAGTEVDLYIAATVDAVSAGGVIWRGKIDTKYVSDLQDITAAQVNAEADQALADYAPATAAALATVDANVDSVLEDTGTTLPATLAALNNLSSSDITSILTSYGTATTTNISDLQTHGDGAWLTATGFSTHSAADVWTSGTRTLSSFGTLVSDITTAVWASGSRTLTSFGTLVSDIWAAVTDSSGVTTLLSRLSAARAGYLDKLNVTGTLAHSDAADSYKADVSALATASALATVDTNVDSILEDTGTTLPATLAALPGTTADSVWDEVLTGATHNVATSAGRRLRELAGTVVVTGVAAGAGANGNQIILDSDASSLDGAYDPALVAIVAGTGAGQSRLILEYAGSTKTATVDRTWKVNPSTDSEYIVYAHPGREHVNEGLAQAATSNTITLNAYASSANDAYNGQLIFIRSGYGEDQLALITDYVGSTKVATIDGTWATTPNTTSAYVLLPCRAHTISDMQSGLATSAALATVDGIVDSILTNTGTDIPALIAALNDLSASEVATEIADALGTDALAELATDPGATPTVKQALMLLYMWLHNANTATSSARTIKNNAGTAVLTAAVSDDGTTFNQGNLNDA